MKWSLFSLVPLVATLSTAAPSAPGWSFNLKQTRSGIVALESIVVSPTLVVFFDRASNDPLQINNHSAWGALWNLETDTVTPLDLITNSFCASGALLSNGTMVANYYSCPKHTIAYPHSHVGERWRRSEWIRRKSWNPTGTAGHPYL